MKNKKLFAILTLVCFMFTLMPVAAFAAPANFAGIKADNASITEGGDVLVDLYDTNGDVQAAVNEYYVVAMQLNDAGEEIGAYKKVSFTTTAAVDGNGDLKVTIPDAGDYNLYVVNVNDANDEAHASRVANAISAYRNGEIDLDTAAKNLIKESDVTMLDKTAYVSSNKADKYELKFVTNMGDVTADKDGNPVVTLKANSGFDTITAYAKLTNNSKVAVGKEVTVKSGSPAVEVTTTGVTNGAGLVKLELTSATIAGNFEVSVKYGIAKDTLYVTTENLAAASIVKTSEPTAPIALGSAISASDVYFQVTDANGNNVDTLTWATTDSDYKVAVTAPKGSAMKANDLRLTKAGDNWTLGCAENKTVKFDKEGTYTFKAILANGDYATATVEVKEFQEPVELKLVYPTNTVELNGRIKPDSIKYVDANGVTMSLYDAVNGVDTTEVKLSANGYAVNTFTAATGELRTEADEKYVGSKITVLAVAKGYNLVATAELSVANEAAAVKYATNKADVAVNNTLVANVVDMDGNNVALNYKVVGKPSIQYIVLDQPEGSKVAVSTKDASKLATKGEFKVSFTASEIGTYKIQTVVEYQQADNVIKYYSGIEEITVGNNGFEDVVVMSIGSTEIVVNGAVADMGVAPEIKNNRTFVPYRAGLEALGATVNYDEATGAVTAELDGTTVVMTIGSTEYTVNGVAADMGVAPYIDVAAGRTMVPVRFAAQAFGITVTPTYNNDGTTADVLFAN